MSTVVYVGSVMCSFLNHAPVSEKTKQQEIQFAGSASCAACHTKIYKSHIQTAHYLDSKPAAKEFIKGSFAPGKNRFVYNKFSEVILEQEDKRFFQVALINGTEIQREPFDIVIGSGRKGQSYLYWNDNDLFQLPVSYYTPRDNWCNSPGFTTNYIRFNRVVNGQCLECHATYAKGGEPPGNVNTFDKTQIIYGIDCEKCHGPAAEHVSFHRQHPEEKKGRHIINTKNMNRQQRLDACALCHSGFRNAIQPYFSFKPGDKLDEFSTITYNKDSSFALDVHGNQFGLLTSSKCFQMTQMDCSSCHDVHTNEVNKPALFSQRCITCHKETDHNSLQLTARQASVLSSNCIDCHMPMLPSQAIVLNVANAVSKVPDTVRTHRITIYPEITRKFLKELK